MIKSICISCFIITIISCSNSIPSKKNDLKNKKYDSLIKKGVETFQQKNIEATISNFKKAISIDSSKPKGYYHLGVTYTMLCNQDETDNCKKALASFKKVADKNPDYEKINYNTGIAYFNLQQYKSALNYFNKAIIKDPTDFDYYINRAFVKLNLKDTTNACLDFRKAYKLGDNEAKGFIADFCID